LPDDLRDRARVFDLVSRGAREMIGGDVADAVAAGLDRMHLDSREVREDIGHIDKLRPIELDVLARGEVAVALVVCARDVRLHAQLARIHRAVGHRDAEHVSVKLEIESVHQPERLELVFGQFAR
jgi:hypothetical protein